MARENPIIVDDVDALPTKNRGISLCQVRLPQGIQNMFRTDPWSLIHSEATFSGGYSLLACDIATGRTHQIRVHMPGSQTVNREGP